MAVDWGAIAKILEAVAWPLVAVSGFLGFRKPLRAFVERIATQTTKLSLGDYSIEMSEMREGTTQWQSMSLDVRKMTSSDVFDSASHSLFSQLTQQDQADYVVIDLGTGNQWLTSRLFIFAVVLGRVRGVKVLTFVATREGVGRRYIGAAEPQKVHLSLAHQYPWLEAALAAACQPYDPHQDSNPFAFLAPDPVEMWQVQSVVGGYVDQIQQMYIPNSTEQWESLDVPPSQIWERTTWVTIEHVEEIFRSILMRGYVVSSPDRPRREVVEATLRSRDKFVAILDEDRRLVDLIDRSELVDRFVRETVG